MRTIIAALIFLAGAVPVLAATCAAGDTTLALDEDGNPSELAQVEMDTMRLRREGYHPMWVERWSGCIKVTYRDDDGRLVTEFLDPTTLEPVDVN